MLENLVRRNAALVCALLLVLCALAAPYLTSIDPDSPVFRSNTMGMVLLLGCAFPVLAALRKNSLRSLLFGLFYALLFCFFLGLGSELAVYGNLLPGMGSLLRRMAVPVMAAPFLGALFSYLMEVRLPAGTGRLALPWIAYFLPLALIYFLYFLAFYPGIVNYDFFTELQQYLYGPVFGAHPVFHTLLTGILYTAGHRVLGTWEGGAVFYSVFQLLALAAIYACVCRFAAKRLPKLAALALFAFFALHPIHGFLAISTIKDTLFTGFMALLCMQLWAVYEHPQAFFQTRRAPLCLSLCCLMLSLLRHNGIFAYAFALLALCLLVRSRKAVLYAAVTVALCLALPQGLRTLMHAWDTPSSEMMSIPCQQLMRTANYADLTPEEFQEIDAWYTGQSGRYRPHSADPAKGGNFDYNRYVKDKGAFWSLWLRYARRCPRIYLEAFLQNCAGLWNPDDVSHAHALDTEQWTYVYTKTEVLFPAEVGVVEQHSRLPRLQQFLNEIAHSSRHERIPIVSLLFRPSLYVYALLLLSMRARCLRKGRQRLPLLPAWGIILSYVFSACILIRYAYAFMAVVPLFLLLCLFEPDPAGEKKN